MQILTPTGYREMMDCVVGDEVSAFDMETGASLVNAIESIAWVDAAEWHRWHMNAELPPFKFYRINGRWTLNSEQSIWRNGTNVCHAKHLVIGDEIYDDEDQSVTITSIEEIELDGWWRFDISGDHSYIVDGLTLHNASRFWVGGTASWTAINTTPWAASSNGAGGQSVPGSADTVTIDANSGAGTITVNFGSTITAQSITCGAMGMTLDFSANNNSVTLSAATGFSNTGSGTRTVNLGNGTWTLTGNGNVWNMTTVTNLTFNANSSTIVCTATTSSARAFIGGGKSFSTVTISGNTSGGLFTIRGGANTFGTLNITAPNYVQFTQASTTIVTNAFTWTGSSSSQIGIETDTPGSAATISVASGSPTMSWSAVREMTFTGGATFTATSSFSLGNNNGITITAPSSSGGISRARALGGF